MSNNVSESTNAQSHNTAAAGRGSTVTEQAEAHGRFTAELRDKDGNLKWRDEFDNTVCTAGKNLALDTFLAGSAYTVVGPFMGLISSTSYSAIAAADTMASHAGWLEAGGSNAPTYSGNRKTAAWSSASSGAKALSASLTFTFTGTGTVKGAFLAFGSGAVNAKDDTNGTLYSAGLLTRGDTAVISGDTLSVAYSTSL